MAFILGLSGSLRRAATTTGLLRGLSYNLPLGIRTEIADLNMPIYNKDLQDSRRIPDSVRIFREQAQAADAFVFSMPENTYGVSSPMQNAIDWALKANGGNVFAGKVCAVIGVGQTSSTPRYYRYMKDWAADMQMTMIDQSLFVSRTCAQVNAFDLKTGDVISEEVIADLGKIVNEILRASGKEEIKFDVEEEISVPLMRKGYYVTFA